MLLCMYEKAKASALREHELVTEYDYIFSIKLSISLWKIDIYIYGSWWATVLRSPDSIKTVSVYMQHCNLNVSLTGGSAVTGPEVGCKTERFGE